MAPVKPEPGSKEEIQKLTPSPVLRLHLDELSHPSMSTFCIIVSKGAKGSGSPGVVRASSRCCGGLLFTPVLLLVQYGYCMGLVYAAGCFMAALNIPRCTTEWEREGHELLGS
jgi:hypothetical protein